jgi:DNA-binding IscR family transcriptional regulator
MKYSKKTITLANVVIAIDGDGMLKNCVLGLDVCSNEHPCAVHHQFVALRNQFTNVLEDTSVVDVVNHLAKMKAPN